MGKLLKLNPEELADKYFHEFGYFPLVDNRDTIIAALYYQKPINYLSQEEIQTINEI